MNTATTSDLRAHFSREKTRYVEELSQFLSFPSISADERHLPQCTACAEWLAEHLRTIGFPEVALIPTSGKPIVYAHRPGSVGSRAGAGSNPGGAPHVSFYGHYDVQPPDPLELWNTPPFEPTLRGSRLYARGAQDNKGQLFFVLKALEELIKSDSLPCAVSLFIEGEEESGSRGITQSLPALAPKLKSDLFLVCDTACAGKGIPTITLGLRGLVYLTVNLHGPSKDLHSGSHGGVVKNPATELARLIATLHDANGSVAVAGFYEGVREPTERELEVLNQTALHAETYHEEIGALPLGGEKGRSPLERRGFRPTIEVNGIHSGYGGPGSKTIIPSSAFAKITARLVGTQDPEKSLQRIIKHLSDHAPQGIRLEITESGIGGPAFLINAENPAVKLARAVLDEISDNRTTLAWEGGSIPVVAEMVKLSGAAPLLVGFGLEEDNIHAPNESFDMEQFEMGFLYAARLLSQLSREALLGGANS